MSATTAAAEHGLPPRPSAWQTAWAVLVGAEIDSARERPEPAPPHASGRS